MALEAGDKFVDISSNNDPADIAAYAAAGYRGIAIKCTEGGSYTYFEGNTHHAEAHKHGLIVGRYAWPRPDGPSAVTQADYFVAAVKPTLKSGDFVFPDWETSYNYTTHQPVPDPPDAAWAQFMLDFTARIRHGLAGLSFPVPLVLYTANWYLDGKPHMQAVAKGFEVIIADYVSIAGKPNNRLGLNIAAHQYTDKAAVPGFSRPVDCNVMIKPFTGTTTHRYEDANMADGLSPKAQAQIKKIVDDALDTRLKGPGGARRKIWQLIKNPLHPGQVKAPGNAAKGGQ